MTEITDEMLMAFADGVLAPEESEIVRAAVMRDPELMRTYESFARTGAVLARRYEGVIAQVPQRLMDIPTRRGSWRPSGAFARLVEGLRIPAPSLALAIPALAVAAAAGWLVGTATPTPPEAGGYAASEALRTALETTVAPSTGDIAEGVTLKPTYTFATQHGAWCRQYQLTYGTNLQSAGIACRQADGDWNVIAQTDPGPVPTSATPAGKVTTAGADEDRLRNLRSTIKAGDVLDREQEAALIDRGWRPAK